MTIKIITSIAAATLITGCAATATPVPEADKELQFVEKINLKQEEIFNRSADWFAESFVDSKEVLELKDKARGKIIGKGVIPQCFSMGSPASGFGYIAKCRVTIIVEIKENRVRTTYKDIMALGRDGTTGPIPDKGYNDQAREKISKIQSRFVSYLTKKEKSSNW